MNPILERLQTQPIIFSKKVLNTGLLWAKQEEVLNSVIINQRTSVRSGNGVGKSFVSAQIALHWLYTFPHSIVVLTAPTWRQLGDILYAEIRTQHDRAAIPLGGEVLETGRLKIDTDWFLTCISTTETEKFQGIHSDRLLVIADEAAGIDNRIFEAIDAILTSEHSHLLLIGNPTTNAGYFYDSHKPNSGFNRIKISCLESPNIVAGKIIYPKLVSQSWIDRVKKSWIEGSALWDARVLGEFPTEGTDTLIPIKYIEAALIKELEEGYKGDIELGVDVARFGDDRTVLSVRNGIELLEIETHKTEDTMETVGRVIQFAQKHSETPKEVPIKVDVIGVGSGVVDRLREQGYHVVGVNSSDRADDSDKYINKRTEMCFSLRERFIEGEIKIIQDEELMGELSSPKYKINSTGKFQVEAKDEVKKRIGRSPDLADSCVYCFAPGDTIRDRYIFV